MHPQKDDPIQVGMLMQTGYGPENLCYRNMVLFDNSWALTAPRTIPDGVYEIQLVRVNDEGTPETSYTPGPWIPDEDGWIVSGDGYTVVEYGGCGSHAAYWPNDADKALAPASPQLVEALVKSLRYFEAQNATLLKLGAPDFVALRDEMVAALRYAGIEVP